MSGRGQLDGEQSADDTKREIEGHDEVQQTSRTESCREECIEIIKNRHDLASKGKVGDEVIFDIINHDDLEDILKV